MKGKEEILGYASCGSSGSAEPDVASGDGKPRYRRPRSVWEFSCPLWDRRPCISSLFKRWNRVSPATPKPTMVCVALSSAETEGRLPLGRGGWALALFPELSSQPDPTGFARRLGAGEADETAGCVTAACRGHGTAIRGVNSREAVSGQGRDTEFHGGGRPLPLRKTRSSALAPSGVRRWHRPARSLHW